VARATVDGTIADRVRAAVREPVYLPIIAV
jgi:hypothetical protein